MSNNLQSAIQDAVNQFRDTITQISAEFAKNALNDMFPTTRPTTSNVATNGNGKFRPTVMPSVPSSSNLKKGDKRDPKLIEDTQVSFVAFVKKHPGLRIEQINKQLGSNTKDLMLPIRKALAAGEIKTKGEKRSTTYHPPGK